MIIIIDFYLQMIIIIDFVLSPKNIVKILCLVKNIVLCLYPLTTYNKTVKSRPPLLHVAPRADAGTIPYYAGKRQFLAIVKWQEAV